MLNLRYRRDLPLLMKELGLPMIAVECGVAEGYNSADLLSNGIEKLYMCDVWATIPGQKGDGGFDQEWHDMNYQKAIERVKKFGSKAIILKGYSEAMSLRVADNHLGLVYIDSDHSYEGVMLDIAVWWPKLVSGGLMAFHDHEMTQYGVKHAVQEFARSNKLPINLIPEDKREDAGAWIQKP